MVAPLVDAKVAPLVDATVVRSAAVMVIGKVVQWAAASVDETADQ